jgi:hypothetical protein
MEAEKKEECELESCACGVITYGYAGGGLAEHGPTRWDEEARVYEWPHWPARYGGCTGSDVRRRAASTYWTLGDVNEDAEGAAEHKDDGKPPMSLLSPFALEEIAKGMAYGAKKYAAWNYRKGMKWTKLSSSLLRHTFRWLGGEDIDPESGVHHLALAGCNVFMLLDLIVLGLGKDDRWRKP